MTLPHDTPDRTLAQVREAQAAMELRIRSELPPAAPKSPQYVHVEPSAMEQAMRDFDGHLELAALKLGISPNTLREKLAGAGLMDQWRKRASPGQGKQRQRLPRKGVSDTMT